MEFRLDQKSLDEIFEIYKDVTGSLEDRYPVLEDVKKDLNTLGWYEYRAGSRWSGDSKFIIATRSISFYPNCEPRTKRDAKAIEKAKKLFGKKIKAYIDQIF